MMQTLKINSESLNKVREYYTNMGMQSRKNMGRDEKQSKGKSTTPHLLTAGDMGHQRAKNAPFPLSRNGASVCLV